MIIQIVRRPTQLGLLLPGFVLDAFCNIEVQARKINDVFKVKRQEVLEKMKGKRYGFAHAADFLEKKQTAEEIDLLEAEVIIVKAD